MKYFVAMEDWSGAHIHSEGTYEECINTIRGIYNEMIEFRAVMPMEEWTPILYIEGEDTLIIGGNKLERYTIYPVRTSAERMVQTLNECREYLS